LPHKDKLSARDAEFLQRLEIRPGAAAADGLDLAQTNPVKMLLGSGYALQTALMWVIFFCSLLNLFLFVSWLPEVLHLTGMTPAEAARASSFRELGAIFAVLYLGLLIDRFGPERALAWNYAAGVVFIAAIALVAMPYMLLAVVIFFSGMTIIGSQTGANATCGKLYPARMRTSGLGWALGVGRLGGIAGPVLGGYLLSLGMLPTHIFLSACLFAVIAAAASPWPPRDHRRGLMREGVGAELEFDDERARRGLRRGAGRAGRRRVDALDVERRAVARGHP
jgi:MFS transporter, AAHS family, 4-hydroxybenzoate transporter